MEFTLTVTAKDIEAKPQTIPLTDAFLSLPDASIGRIVQVMVETIRNPRPTIK